MLKKEKAVFVHYSPVFPKNGYLVSLLSRDVWSNRFVPYEQLSDINFIRPTLHFALNQNGAANNPNHKANKLPDGYVIIIPYDGMINAMGGADSIVGNPEDYFVATRALDLKLIAGAVILVPDQYRDILREEFPQHARGSLKLLSNKATVTVQAIFKSYMTSKQLPLLTPEKYLVEGDRETPTTLYKASNGVLIEAKALHESLFSEDNWILQHSMTVLRVFERYVDLFANPAYCEDELKQLISKYTVDELATLPLVSGEFVSMAVSANLQVSGSLAKFLSKLNINEYLTLVVKVRDNSQNMVQLLQGEANRIVTSASIRNSSDAKAVNVVAGEDDEKSPGDAEIASSSSDSPASPPGGGGSAGGSDHSSDQQQSDGRIGQYSLHTGQSENENLLMYPVSAGNKAHSEAEYSELLQRYSWIEGLTEVFKQKVLETLEKATYPDKYVTNQLSNQSVEEKFGAEWPKDNIVDNFIDGLQEYAHANQEDDLLVSKEGILIGHMPEMAVVSF